MKIKTTPNRQAVESLTLIDSVSAGPVRGGTCDRDALLIEFYPLVQSVVQSMMSYLPRCADVEELHSVGVTGLVAAVDRYDNTQSNTFKGYAAMRIRGAILDELRRLDTLPRTRRAKVKHLAQVVETLEQELGRAPTDEEIARSMGLSMKQLEKYQRKAKPVVLVSLDGASDSEDEDNNLHEAIPDDGVRPSFERMEKEESAAALFERMKELPERQRKVLAMYYFEEMRLSEIAEVFGVSEARICQIHTQSLASLRKTLKSSL